MKMSNKPKQAMKKIAGSLSLCIVIMIFSGFTNYYLPSYWQNNKKVEAFGKIATYGTPTAEQMEQVFGDKYTTNPYGKIASINTVALDHFFRYHPLSRCVPKEQMPEGYDIIGYTYRSEYIVQHTSKGLTPSGRNIIGYTRDGHYVYDWDLKRGGPLLEDTKGNDVDINGKPAVGRTVIVLRNGKDKSGQKGAPKETKSGLENWDPMKTTISAGEYNDYTAYKNYVTYDEWIKKYHIPYRYFWSPTLSGKLNPDHFKNGVYEKEAQEHLKKYKEVGDMGLLLPEYVVARYTPEQIIERHKSVDEFVVTHRNLKKNMIQYATGEFYVKNNPGYLVTKAEFDKIIANKK